MKKVTLILISAAGAVFTFNALRRKISFNR